MYPTSAHPNGTFEPKDVTDHAHYTQRGLIAGLFGYRLWSAAFLPQLGQQAAQIIRRDVTPGFVATELIVWLNEHQVVRPGYTTLQHLIGKALSAERQRLGNLLEHALDDSAKAALAQRIAHDDTLSELAVLRQDAKDFRWRQMVHERQKRALLGPLYMIAKAVLPTLGISQQNLLYYASLATFYTVYDLRRLRPEQTHLYLLCYVWLRYRQLTVNLVDALAYHMKQLEEACSATAKKDSDADQLRRQQETPQVGRLLWLYVDDAVADTTPFGTVRQRAYTIMPKDRLQQTAQRLSERPTSKLARHWHAVDTVAERVRRQVRPLYGVLDVADVTPNNPWLAALAWAKNVFATQQRLSQRPLAACPVTLPTQLHPYLHISDADGKPTGLHADRFEFWRYRQSRKRLRSGELFLDDSLQYRHFADELVSTDEQADILAQMDIPFLRQPIETQLRALTDELHAQWLAFNRELKQGKLTHLAYDKGTQTLTLHKPKVDTHPAQEAAFYEQRPLCDIIGNRSRFVPGHAA